MRTLIMAGFLGSGKTTVLMEFAHYLVENGNTVVILENEISSAGVDNQILKSRGFQVRNVFAGCICCSSAGILCRDVQQIQVQYNPDWLIIEATGMAYPDGIRDSLRRELKMDACVLTLVDASRWKRVLAAMRQFAVSQLAGATGILVTKVDIVEADVLQEVIRSIRAIVPATPVQPVCAICPIPATVWKNISEMGVEA